MLNIAQIGVGYWGPNLLRNLVSNKRCTVSHVADISPERRDYVKALYPGVNVTADMNEIFTDNAVDAIVVATPVSTHYEVASEALSAGKHILVEKPLARSLDEVDQIARLSSGKRLVAMEGHTFLFNAAVRYVKQLIDTGALGDIHYIYSQRLNLGRIRSDVDALWNFAPHDVSIIQYWLGDPRPVSVMRQGVACIQSGIEDVVFLNITYPRGIMANVHVSWLDPHRLRCMTVVGSKKMVVYDDVAENKIAIHDKGIERKAAFGNRGTGTQPFAGFEHRSGDVVFPKIDFKEPLQVEIDHFIDCIQNGSPCMTGPDHARKVVQILTTAA